MSPTVQHHYQTLGLEPFASLAQVKQAYRQLARQHHPDLNQTDRAAAEERLKRLNQAYEVLKDPQRKLIYDTQLKIRLSPPPAPSPVPPPVTPKASPQSSVKKPVSPQKVGTAKATPEKNKPSGPVEASKGPVSWWQQVWQAPSGSPPSGASGSVATDQPKPVAPPQQGEMLESPLLLSPAEAETGCVKTVELVGHLPCEQCYSSGRVKGQLCPACQGVGHQIRQRALEVRIPAGVKAGAKIKVEGQGQPAPDGKGKPGDLILTIQVAARPELQIRGLNSYLDWRIPLPLAVLGGMVQVPTVRGEVDLLIPPGSQPGQTLRLKEQGVSQGGLTGDQFVTLQVTLPTALSAKQRKLYEQLLALEPKMD